jgi:hypothetical protein
VHFLTEADPSWNPWNSDPSEPQTPISKPQNFWTNRSVVWILIFLEKFETISSAEFIGKILHCWFHWKNSHCWFHWKKFSQIPNGPNTQNRLMLFPFGDVGEKENNKTHQKCDFRFILLVKQLLQYKTTSTMLTCVL